MTKLINQYPCEKCKDWPYMSCGGCERYDDYVNNHQSDNHRMPFDEQVQNVIISRMEKRSKNSGVIVG